MIVNVIDKYSGSQIIYFKGVKDVTKGIINNSVCVQTKDKTFVFVVNENEVLEIIKD